MRSILHEIDPDGDLIVVLNEPNTLSIIPDVYVRPPAESENPDFVLDFTWLCAHRLLLDDESPVEVRYRVSSRHLMLASVTFKKMLSGPWKESQPAESQPVDSQHLSLQEMHQASYVDSSSDTLSPGDDQPSNRPLSHSPCIREVSTTGWNANALLTVFNIIHSQCSEVPRSPNLDYLTDVAVIANYYQCAGALSLVVQLWLELNPELSHLRVDRSGVPYGVSGLQYGSELLMWLFVGWVFSERFLLDEASCIVMNKSHGLSYIDTYDLPINEILATLEKKRLNGLQSLTSALRDMKGKVKRNELGCGNHRCRAMVIGSLELNLEEHPELIVEDGNYDGMSISEVVNTVQHEFGPSENEMHDDKHICTPKLLMQSIIEDVKHAIGVACPYPEIW